MDLGLAHKVALVTGASRGVGRAIAEVLSQEQMRLVLVARSADLLNELKAALPGESLVHVADLREPHAAEAAVKAAVQHFGQLDLLVNNAGATKRGDFLALSEADWADGFALKFHGARRLCREAWRHLVVSQGAVVNIVGVGGRTASAEFTIGGSVNSALLNFSKALAHRGSGEGVRVNAINPGSIATDRLQGRIRALAAERGIEYDVAAREMAQKLGVPRFGQPEEIARMVAFLGSPAAGYCQGSLVDVDGGQTRTL
jgi:3-oxoacyl-[acyl-carrier protein] reductase